MISVIFAIQIGAIFMKIRPFTYYLVENGRVLHHSIHFEKLLNFTTETRDAVIYFEDKPVWKQNP